MTRESFRKRPLTIFCLALLLLAVPSAAARPGDGGKRYALLVAVGAYQQWGSLVNPIPDVHALAGELQRYGFLPEILENPSREDVIAKLRRYLQLDYGPGDQLVIVFAGHGTYDEVSRIGYLVASDSANRQRDPNFVTLLNYPWLLTLIDNIDCPEILLVVDACYSGSLGGAGNGSPGRGLRRFLTSGGKEYVPDGDPDRHTPFMRQLLAGLRSVAASGALPLAKLQEGFMSHVEPRPRWGRFGGDHGEGDFVFLAGESAVPPPRPVVASATPPAAPPAVSSRLRSTQKNIAENELERAFVRLEIFDNARNPEGDFPNEHRVQEKGLWAVVVDLEAGLMWQQSGSDRRMDPREAAAYVDALNREGHAGYRDWRLPTLEELATLIEPERQSDDLFISRYFDTEQEVCWTADRDAEGRQSYYVSFNAGRAVLAFGDKTAFVRAVRTN